MNVLKNIFGPILYITYMTVQPDREAIDNYISTMESELLGDGTQLWFIGRLVENIDRDKISSETHIFQSITELVDAI